jgi:hypothetical protein
MTKKQATAKRSEATVADVLHLAADKYLAANQKQRYRYYKSRYSCGAVGDACVELNVKFGGVLVGLKNMGCDTTSSTLFYEYGDNNFFNVSEEVQGMRYMWLKWAALMAEEQGV